MNLIYFHLLFFVSLCMATPYQDLNQHNLKMYANARALDFINVSYIMIQGDSPQLYYQGKLIDSETSMTFNTTYDILKEISHLSLAIISNFGGRCGKFLSDQQVIDFNILLRKMYESYEPIYTSPLIPNELRASQVIFINESIKIVGKLLDKLKFDCKDMQAYIKTVRPILDKNLYAASLSQLTDLNKVIRSWNDKYTQIDWKSIYVVQCGSHMPREKNIIAQYFQKLLNIDHEGEKFVYAETGDETTCRNLLATHITDRSLAVNIFNEPMRFHRDLLGDAAETIIPKLVGNSSSNTVNCKKIKFYIIFILILVYIFS